MNIFICSHTRTRSLFQIVPIRVPNLYLSMSIRTLFQIVPIWGEDRLWLCAKAKQATARFSPRRGEKRGPQSQEREKMQLLILIKRIDTSSLSK